MTQFTILQLLDEILPRHEQINESSASANLSTDSWVETLIPENDVLFPKCDTVSIGTQRTKKSTREKGTQYKDATIRNRKSFTQTVSVITCKTISTQTMPHPCTCSGAHLGFSEGRGPNFRKGQTNVKRKRNKYKSYIGDTHMIVDKKCFSRK